MMLIHNFLTCRDWKHGRCHVLPRLIELSGVVLSCFKLFRLTSPREPSPIQLKDSPTPLYKAIVYSRSWVWKLINTRSNFTSQYYSIEYCTMHSPSILLLFTTTNLQHTKSCLETLRTDQSTSKGLNMLLLFFFFFCLTLALLRRSKRVRARGTNRDVIKPAKKKRAT